MLYRYLKTSHFLSGDRDAQLGPDLSAFCVTQSRLSNCWQVYLARSHRNTFECTSSSSVRPVSVSSNVGIRVGSMMVSAATESAAASRALSNNGLLAPRFASTR